MRILIVFLILNIFGFFQPHATELGKDSTHFTINGRRTFLLGISYYGALGARDEFIAKDLDDMQRDGFNWIRVWATWAAFTNNISAVETNGGPREPFLTRLEKLVQDCDRRGMIVDITFSREKGPRPWDRQAPAWRVHTDSARDQETAGPRLQRLSDHERAVRTVVERLRPLRNWYLDLGNERNIQDARHVPFEDLKRLREVVRELDPKRLVTASHSSDDESFAKDIEKYLRDVKVDFICNHRRRGQGAAGETAAATKLYFARMKEIGITVPIHYDEPFRRGYTKGWEPTAEDFLHDLRGAIESGAAGWCFHNGSEVGPKDSEPRRSFDLREKRLYDQLDPIELEVTRKIKDERDRAFLQK
jgi:hypothetical protein